MGTVYEAALAFFRQDDWPAEPFEDKSTILTRFKSENGEWMCIAQIIEDEATLLFYSICPQDARPDQYGELSRQLTELNYGLVLGNFELSLEDGDLRFKTALSFRSFPPEMFNRAEVVHEFIREMVYTNVLTMDTYLPELLPILNGGTNATQAGGEPASRS